MAQNSRTIRPHTEAQRKLLERPESGAELAAATGASRSSVSSWRHGTCQPSAAVQQRLRDLYGIALDDWIRAPTVGPGVEPGALAPTDLPQDAAGLRAFAARAEQLATDPGLSSGVRAKWATLELRCKAELSRRIELTGDEAMQIPSVKAVLATVVAALQPFPQALDAVADALHPKPEAQPAPEASSL